MFWIAFALLVFSGALAVQCFFLFLLELDDQDQDWERERKAGWYAYLYQQHLKRGATKIVAESAEDYFGFQAIAQNAAEPTDIIHGREAWEFGKQRAAAYFIQKGEHK